MDRRPPLLVQRYHALFLLPVSGDHSSRIRLIPTARSNGTKGVEEGKANGWGLEESEGEEERSDRPAIPDRRQTRDVGTAVVIRGC